MDRIPSPLSLPNQNFCLHTTISSHADVTGEEMEESKIPPALVLPLGRLYFGKSEVG